MPREYSIVCVDYRSVRAGRSQGSISLCVLTIDSQGGEIPREYFIVCVDCRSVRAGKCQGSISLCVLTVDQSGR